VGVLVLQATLFVIAIGTTLRYGPYEVSTFVAGYCINTVRLISKWGDNVYATNKLVFETLMLDFHLLPSSHCAPYFHPQVSYLPNDIASAVGDPAGLFDFNGLEVTSSSWHFVLEPAGTRRRLTESEWDAAQASMRADVLAEAEAIHRSVIGRCL